MSRLNNLDKTNSYSRAVLMNLSKSLIKHKKLTTTLTKGKALRRFLEPILTKTKLDTIHSRRVVFSFFQDKEPVKELFNEIAPRIHARPGGYLRVIKTGHRLGDNAATCLVEIVDYNTIYNAKSSIYEMTMTKRYKTRRGKKSSKNKKIEQSV